MTLSAVGQSKRPEFLSLLAIVCLFTGGSLPAADTLTNASAVLTLPATRANSNIPVSVVGVVTAAETNWLGRFFVQDASGGVFVDNRSNPQPLAGDLVQVTGVSHPGGYAPVITKPHWKRLAQPRFRPRGPSAPSASCPAAKTASALKCPASCERPR
jgi:hypothetical protein